MDYHSPKKELNKIAKWSYEKHAKAFLISCAYIISDLLGLILNLLNLYWDKDTQELKQLQCWIWKKEQSSSLNCFDRCAEHPRSNTGVSSTTTELQTLQVEKGIWTSQCVCLVWLYFWQTSEFTFSIRAKICQDWKAILGIMYFRVQLAQ